MDYGFIFDMDGVIIDSNPFHKISWGKFLKRKGIPYSDEIFNNIMSGKTGETSLRILIDPELSDQQIKDYLHEIDGDFQDIFRNAEHVESYPGVSSFLEIVNETGLKTALATSAPPGNVDIVLERLGLREYFDIILDSTDVKNGKPDPEIYLSSVKRMELETHQCMVFEDSKSGIQSAIAAGLTVVGVSSSHTREELWNEGVNKVIKNFYGLTIPELLTLLQ